MISSPIFILAISPRSGSTYLSRLLTSTDEVIVWGESTLFTFLYPLNHPTCFWTKEKDENKNYDLHFFRKNKHEMFSNRLLPLESDLEKHWCQMTNNIFEEASKREGYSRWGLKETTWKEYVIETIKRNWVSPKIIYLYRDFESCYKSTLGAGFYDGKYVESCRHYIQDWIRIGKIIANRKNSDIEHKFNYDDVVLNPNIVTNWCDLPPSKPISKINSTAKEITNKRHLEIYYEYKKEIDEVSKELGL